MALALSLVSLSGKAALTVRLVVTLPTVFSMAWCLLVSKVVSQLVCADPHHLFISFTFYLTFLLSREHRPPSNTNVSSDWGRVWRTLERSQCHSLFS